jgi:hypothetical protein
MAIKRPVPIVWTDDPQNEGAGYDQTSADGEIPLPASPPERRGAGASRSWPLRGDARRVRKLGRQDLQGNLARSEGGSSRCSEHPRASFRERRRSIAAIRRPVPGRRPDRGRSAIRATSGVGAAGQLEPRPEL